MTGRRIAHQIARVRESLASEIRAAIAAAPCGVRALARSAGVSNQALVRIRQGTLAATPRVALRLAEALDLWGLVCQRAAKRLRKAARRVPTPRTGRKP